MMTLRKMTEDEFRAFKKFSVADYASQKMSFVLSKSSVSPITRRI